MFLLLQRCIKRLQDGRARLVDRFRNSDCKTEEHKSSTGLVREVMAEEWNVLKMENDELLSGDPMTFNPFSSSIVCIKIRMVLLALLLCTAVVVTVVVFL